MRFYLILIILYNSLSSIAQIGHDQIRLNQIGFYPDAPKTAIVVGKVSNNVFFITSTNQRDTFFRGHLTPERNSIYSSTICRTADFTSLNTPGSYILVLPEIGHSYNFSIGENILRSVAISALKGYYYQRCSMPLENQFAGKWHRSAGHPDTAVYIHPSAYSKERPAGTIISAPGGWYDAGNYNKYVVNSGISMGTLLSAYEDFPNFFQYLKTNIPAIGNGIPDILNECLYNLRWMMKMQDPYDGGVYNKCSNAVFDGMVMPGVTLSPRYVVQKGTAATLDFVAVTAKAARIFKSYKIQFPGLADSCINAANAAWKWCLIHPQMPYDQNEMNRSFQPLITTGAYGDNRFDDEWFWAACELFVTTKDTKYLPVIKQSYSPAFSIPGWNNVAMPGIYSLLRSRNNLPLVAGGILKDISDHILKFADTLIAGSGKSAFNTIIGQSRKDFIWGSNAVAANQSIVLLNAYLVSGNRKYIQYALTNLDYILGRNATGYCFLTGAGSKSPMHPHHRQSISDGVIEPVPGLMAGGPNPGMQDKSVYEYTEPETAYTDKSEAYACNEIAINWNAPLVYLVSAIEALQKKL